MAYQRKLLDYVGSKEHKAAASEQQEDPSVIGKKE
jgi:hypothetical protein